MKELQQRLQKLQVANAFVESCAKKLAERLLRLAIEKTPVEDYNKPVKFTTIEGKEVSFTPRTGKTGGNLKRGWTGSKSKSSAQCYAESLAVNHFGDMYVIEIVNPVEYASYVEYVHRTANHSGWVKGNFMMTISEQELQMIAPRVHENKIKKYLGGCLK